jgi:alpha-L-rhamnosidase
VGTGLIGGQWLNRVLTDGGRPDLVYRFATHTDYPGWGYMIKNGATTVWELWNGDTADPAMNSGNHVMLVGDFVVWLYEDLAGIRSDPAQPGFKHIIMKPYPVGDLKFARATFHSPYGLIRSDWQREGKTFRWQVAVPPNTTATLYLPASDAAGVKESGRSAHAAQGVKFLRQEGDRLLFDANSQEYEFGVR